MTDRETEQPSALLAQSQELGQLLAERYPATFSWPASKPLAIGIHCTIAEETGCDPTVLAFFLRFWTSRASYLKASEIGEPRHNLDGSIAGTMTAQHKLVAARKRAARLAAIKRKKAALEALPEPATPEPAPKPSVKAKQHKAKPTPLVIAAPTPRQLQKLRMAGAAA